MSDVRIHRPIQTVKPSIVALSNDTKVKVRAAIQTVVNKIKDRHLS